MRERPIIFSAPMVRAILAGQKTQTRREAKGLIGFTAIGQPVTVSRDGFPCEYICPYGKPGDRLWVREAWAAPHAHDHLVPRWIPRDARIHYAATEDRGGLIWRSPIFMPRWASRITLEITSIRVERLQDISETDAEAEGASYAVSTDAGFEEHPLGTRHEGFAALWQKINGAGSWAANPWVWALAFRRAEGGAA